MNMIKILAFVVVVLFGIFMFIYGGMDDSPGAQLLGVLVVVAGIASVVRSKKSKE